MALDVYRKKRNFQITPEPEGKVVRRKSKELSFVIQKHRASHMHYDFRLELNGVLLSWAVPKGPSLDPAHKRLAMQTEDHPIEYGGFEGTIPAKQYGAGTVLLWDRGTWSPRGDADADYRKGRLKFELHGEKLHGGWTLVRSYGSKYGSDKASWLLIKEKDEFARPGEPLVVDELPDSVATGRSLEEIAADPDRVWHSNKSVAENVKSGAVRKKKPNLSLESVKGAAKRSMPDFVAPELATLMKTPPEGSGWVHEMKLDGYRMLCKVENGTAQMVSRNAKEWTGTFESVKRCAARLPVDTAWLDGEVVVLEKDGRTSFQALQNALTGDHAAKLRYFVFDLIYLNGHDLRQVPLIERKRLLKIVLAGAPDALRFSEHIEASGQAFYKQACDLKLEGMISKRAESPYQSGRCRDWLKVKCSRRQELVVGGYTDPEGSRVGFGALLLGVYEPDGKLRYSGKVGTGFNDKTLRELYQKLHALETKEPPFKNPPRGYEAKGAHWIRPELVAEIEFTEWTNEGTLRHPSFQGLREDKNPKDVVREKPADAQESGEQTSGEKPARAKREAKSAAKSVAAKSSPSRKAAAPEPETTPDTVAGVKISNPAKVLYPEAGITKLDVARYYAAVAEWILPHLENRPLTLVRCPSGWEKSCFFQKHPDAKVSEVIERVTVQESKGATLYMMANSPTALIALTQMGAIELHPFGSRSPKLSCPDMLVFDFDPADDISWKELVDAVRLLKTLLEELGLQTFIKTTGGKGLHVVVPVRPALAWDDVKAFTRAIAELMVQSFPDRFIATMTKSKRHGKIFVDYLRNSEGATAIAPYSLRARANAPVATPIAWEELKDDIRREHFNLRNVPERLATIRQDPWADFFDVKQSITKVLMKKVGA
jgi:bifunctional non-homologous end joining protein LigD